MEAKKLIAVGFILVGLCLVSWGGYLIIAKNQNDPPRIVEPVSRNTTNTSYNTAPSYAVGNSKKRSAHNSSEIVKIPPTPQPMIQRKAPTEMNPVKETPPYPAPDGTKWTKAKNGWILSPIDPKRTQYDLIEFAAPKPTPTPIHRERPPVPTNLRCNKEEILLFIESMWQYACVQ